MAMASALRALGKLPPHVLIEYSTGKWGFVGSVHPDLSYRMTDGSSVPAELRQKIASFGRGLFKNQVVSCAWDSRQDAIDAAEAIGQTVTL